MPFLPIGKNLDNNSKVSRI